MEWIDGKISRSSFVDSGITLYRINDEIYDEIIYRDKKYYLIRRCGVEPYRIKHGREVYVTNKEILIYALDDKDIYEQEIELTVLKSFCELTTFSMIGGEYITSKFTLDTDKRYIEYVDTYTGNELSLDMSKYDDSRESYIYKIKNMLPHELIDNDLFVSDFKSPPNIIINGYSFQEVMYDENGNLLSPTFDNPSKINSVGRLNRYGNYDINIGYYKNYGVLQENSWACKTYSDFVYNNPESWIGNNNYSHYVEYTVFDEVLNSGKNGILSQYITPYGNPMTVNASMYVFSDRDISFTCTTFSNNSGRMYFNGEYLKYINSGPNKFTFNFIKGWNHIEYFVLWNNATGGFYFDEKYLISKQDFTVKCFNYLPENELLATSSNSNSLYSIGSVSDKIYRDIDNNWKFQKNINEYIFTGDEIWTVNSLSSKLNEFTFKSELWDGTEGEVNVLSDYLLGVTSATNSYEISITENQLKCVLPSSAFPDVASLQDYCKNYEFKIYYKTLNQDMIDTDVSYHNLASYINKNSIQGIFIEEFEFDDLVTIDYTTSVTCNYYKVPISIVPEKTYILTRPINGDVWYFEYYDKDRNIIGYSEYFDTNAITIEVTIPQDVHYICILDGTNTTERNYSLKEKDTYGVEDSTISQLQITINNETSILNLPHELDPGDELEYDIDMNRWTYYPLSIDEDFIYYDGVFSPILLEKTDTKISVQNGVFLTAAVSCINARELTYPKNVTVEDAVYTGDYGYGKISWDEVAGATEYAVYVDGELIASVDNNPYGVVTYHCPSEQMGNVTIMGYNDLLTSELSDPVYMRTVPNSPILESVDTVYENSRYYVTIKFTANSSIADVYEVLYSIDGANNMVVNFDHDGTYGKPIEYTFNAPAINSSFTIQLTSTNETGRNDYIPSNVLVTNSGFSVWTYKTALEEMLLGWIDEFDGEIGYSIKYSIDKGEWKTLMTDGKPGAGTRLLEYISLLPEEEMRVCLAVVKDGYVNIYTKPITISKALDKTLIPPANFEGTKINTGQIQFTWDDNYDVDADFELYYQYSDGTSETVIIPKESSTTGDYTYIYDVGVYGFVTAKLRMIWELGESEYTENIIVYNIPVVSEAPALLPRKRENNKLKISWETYEFIQKYILYFTVDGVQTVIEQVDSEYYWDIPYDKTSVSINAAVKALFIDGTYTNISSSLNFNICNTDSMMESVIYTHHEEPKNLYTTVYSRGLQTSYYLNTLSMNSFEHLYRLYERIYSSYLFKEYKLEENYWGHGVGESYPLTTTVKGSFLLNYPLEEIFYSNVETDNTVQTVIYVPTTTEYPLYSEIVKVAIACLGDSITAGHPNFWAETNSGIIESQYEYWLNIRLKNEFDVINKGYGQEKTIDMLERFDRDILPLEPRYCIILGGTNDYVKTYIVRCNRKLCSVCL